MCADLHPSSFMQHCCARKRDSPQPVTHSDFAWVDIQKTTGPQVTIKNEMYYAVWLSWHVSLCLCQQRNKLGPTAHSHLMLSSWLSSRSKHTLLVPTPPAAPNFFLQELSDFALLPLSLAIRRVSAFSAVV